MQNVQVIEFNYEMKSAINQLITTIAEDAEETSGHETLKFLFNKYGLECPE